MRQTMIALAVAASLAVVGGCGEKAKQAEVAKDTVKAEESMAVTPEHASNLLLAEWTGPFGGVPAFDKMKLEDLKPAIEKGIEISLTELDAIAADPAKPTFANTIVPMERSGAELGRATAYYGIWAANMSSPEFRKVQQELAPIWADYESKIYQNKDLFKRIKAIYDQRDAMDLDAEQKRVVELIYTQFSTNGATLEGEAKERYAEINKRLAELYTKFSNNVLADEEGYDIFLSKDQLSGLPESFVAAAAALAEEKGEKGKYAITNTRSSMDPFLTYSDNRELRKQVWTNYYSRGDNGDERDNNAIIAEILKLRDERVGLQGFDNYAEWRLQDRMAKTPERAMELMEAVWPAAVARVKEEVADMQAVADAEKANITIEPWDYRYYAEKVRKAKYDLNSDEVKQYLQLDNLREAMFYVAGELFNFKFTPVKEGSVPVFHEDVKVWEVTDKTSGDHIGLWYLDPFARAGKRSGAWATMYRDHSTFDGKKNVLSSNNSNFIKGAPGEPVLVSWDDAETFFHEFGHALHFLASNVTYPTLNSGVRDYTEFQSQLLERWLSTDAVIDNYLVHYKTGEPIPADLVKKIKKAAKFNSGFATTEYLASALIDMKFHTVDPEGIDPDKFERETLDKLGMPNELVMRHRTPHFGHIFSGEGYAASYYGYMWADVLTSDASEAFSESKGGFYDKEVAAKLVKHLFAPRNAVDPADAYRAFRGRDANIEALMRDRGFPIPEKKESTVASKN
ncbi:M3 family metallopeptidase [Microbulbifer sp. THAF38]|uniref:M3 family metallopeptidase n=1 Tax=Microbulbifer sp. THAF38 TaxID=2587856 RepID=UPI001268565A|nr:M3 family metallopeptidase [Microbulbifer sp. THAF38]QFT55359.1 Peptidyl-dipeptidase dcp [Microbulbifer sp. THAF38]